tara:strand:- start:6 stop:308 length:303 start_codon:yes stop_codon:yes gene_type:complete
VHYIIGTVVRVSNRAQSSGPRSITAQQVKRTNNTPFNADKVYTLYNIQKNDDGVKYTFTDNGGGQLELVFNEPLDADKCIANALGERLPEYDEFWSRSSA